MNMVKKLPGNTGSFEEIPEYEFWRFELEKKDRQQLNEIVQSSVQSVLTGGAQGTQHFQT